MEERKEGWVDRRRRCFKDRLILVRVGKPRRDREHSDELNTNPVAEDDLEQEREGLEKNKNSWTQLTKSRRSIGTESTHSIFDTT